MRLIPGTDDFGPVNSSAEVRVAKLIEQVELPGPVSCLYSVHMPVHEYKRMSEIDFLVVWDDTLLVVEVKGGRLGRRQGLWTYTNRYGEQTEKREGPFEQARSAMFALERRVSERLPSADVAYGYLVITPNQMLQPDVEWHRSQYAGAGAMTVAGLAKALTEARRHAHASVSRPVAGGAYGDLLRVLRPDFDWVPTLGLVGPQLEQEYVRLADRQYDLLIGAERQDRILCLGGAGSGKTLLAVETARRAASSGAHVVVTCRSERLADVLASRLDGTGATVVPFGRLGSVPPADVLVVDEGQDLLDVDSSLVLDEAVKGGLSAGRWRIFCDPNNQANVDGTFERQTFEELAASAFVLDLPFNCRNTAEVVTQTQMTTGADLGIARAGAGPAVEWQVCPDDDATAAFLDRRLKELRRQDVALEDIAVVTVRPTVAESAAVRSKAFRTGRLVPASPQDGATDTATLATAADIKGLEARHVCVVDVDDVEDVVARARLYVAMTRPRVSLWVGLSPTAWAQLTHKALTQGAR
jgi:hypothetical protein